MDRKQKRIELPQEFRKYFWDVKFEELSMEDNSRFIVERILNYGDHQDIKWLLAHTQRSDIKSIINKSRTLNPKTRNFWETLLK